MGAIRFRETLQPRWYRRPRPILAAATAGLVVVVALALVLCLWGLG